MPMSLLVGLAAAVPPEAIGANWTQHLLTASAEDPSRDAKCLDGTPPVYWHSPGSGDGADKWYVHMQGGAWCTNPDFCVYWWNWNNTQEDLARAYPAGHNAQYGYFNRSSPGNAMANWNLVMIHYCDGFSFSGGLDRPIHANMPDGSGIPGQNKNYTIHIRGRAILDAVIDDLLANRGMGPAAAALSRGDAASTGASMVVVGGCSAGGMAVYLNCDHWAARIDSVNPTTQTRCLADSGFFMFPTLTNTSMFFQGWSMHNLTVESGLDAGCVAAQKPTEAWRCAAPEIAIQFVKTPLFAFNSKYDSYQLPGYAECPQNTSGALPKPYAPCSEALLDAWADQMTDKLRQWTQLPQSKKAGHAGVSCRSNTAAPTRAPNRQVRLTIGVLAVVPHFGW